MSFVEVGTINLKECISSIDFSPSGDFLAVGIIEELVYLWKKPFDNMKDKKEHKILEGHTMGVIDVKFNSEDTRLIVSCLDSTVKVWDADKLTNCQNIKLQANENWKLTFLDRRTFLTCGEQGKVQSFNCDSAELESSFKTEEIYSTSITSSKDGQFIAVGNQLGSIFYFDRNKLQDDKEKENKILQFIKVPDGHGKTIRALCFSQDSKHLMTCSDDQQIYLYDFATQKKIGQYSGHKGNVNNIEINPTNQNQFVTCSYDKTLKIWDLSQSQALETIQCHTDNIWSCKYSHDGSMIASGSENGMLFFHQLK